MKKPMPTPPVSISAATMASQERPMPMRRPVKMYGAADGIMIFQKNSSWLSRSTARDVAIILRDVADADGGVDDHRPDRGDEDHEDRRRPAVAERGERDRQPGERRHGAQHLEDRIEPAHRPDRLADQRAEQDADDGCEAEADRHALQRGQDAPAKADVLRTCDEERIDDQVLGIGPDAASATAGSRRASCRGSARRSAAAPTMMSGGIRLRRQSFAAGISRA